MKKKVKILIISLAFLGLFGGVNALLAESPICAVFAYFQTGSYEEVTGNYCICDGVLSGGWAISCRYKTNAGDCNAKRCTGIACCSELEDPS